VKEKTVFFCNSCGGESVKWHGQCPHCGEWNTLVEEKVVTERKNGRSTILRPTVLPQPIAEVSSGNSQRYQLGMSELDNVLGGGLVAGSSLLMGGEPGIGKSTLLSQIANAMSKYGKTLYISGEESLQQIKLRAERLGAISPQILLLSETNINYALESARQQDIALTIIDSIQAVYTPEISSAPGSVSQVRQAAAACLEMAREKECAVILVGHVTKEGMLAGPRVLEHMVDTVLYFEGERHSSFRLLRAVKNRFGSTNEIGIFEMAAQGLLPLSQPSLYFLGQRRHNLPGSIVTCVMQGSRPMLLEVQALVAASSFGNPRRLAGGIDYNRLLMIVAVLERKLGLPLANRDIYINIAGGLKIEDTAADLAIAAAIVSSLKDIAIEEGLIIIGEMGLLGEIRFVGNCERRLKEANSFGFNKALLPAGCCKISDEIKVLAIDDLPDALKTIGLL